MDFGFWSQIENCNHNTWNDKLKSFKGSGGGGNYHSHFVKSYWLKNQMIGGGGAKVKNHVKLKPTGTCLGDFAKCIYGKSGREILIS